VGLNSLKSLNLTNVYPNNNNNNNNNKKKNNNDNKVKSKPLELFKLAGKNCSEKHWYKSTIACSILVFCRCSRLNCCKVVLKISVVHS
jgi:hypothetical protein